jgi:hypothetical protein
MRLEWRDTTDRDGYADDDPCRVVGCHRRPWIIDSGSSQGSGWDYQDAICLFHLPAYMFEFGITASSGPVSVTLFRPGTFASQRPTGVFVTNMKTGNTVRIP